LDGQIWALKANSLTSPLTVTATVTVVLGKKFAHYWLGVIKISVLSVAVRL